MMFDRTAPKILDTSKVFLDKTMLRIGNTDWGSKLVDRGNRGIDVRCGGNIWGYSAEVRLGDIVQYLVCTDQYQFEINFTLLKGDVSIGILNNDGQFSVEHRSFPTHEKIILILPVDRPDLNVSLMIRNGSEPNSVVRVHGVALARRDQAGSVPNIGSADKLDEENADFWAELCGTHLARHIGITDFSPGSLKQFDDWYLGYYSHLFIHIPFIDMNGLDVLEVGLGYGTVSQRLAESGARFVGLDITPGAVNLVNNRLRQAGLPGEAQIGSILSAPFANESFDRVVTIGCLHHTGDMARSIGECWRVLRPGGQLILMVYNAYSFRRWAQARGATARLWLRERFGYRGVLAAKPGERSSYDANEAREEAPHLDVVSVTSLRHLCRRFTAFSCSRENILQEPPFADRPRSELLKTIWPRVGGTDIYATMTKAAMVSTFRHLTVCDRPGLDERSATPGATRRTLTSSRDDTVADLPSTGRRNLS
jgi:SAM-dependent methyltransferase